jgi:hypothetical protein
MGWRGENHDGDWLIECVIFFYFVCLYLLNSSLDRFQVWIDITHIVLNTFLLIKWFMPFFVNKKIKN